MTVEYGNPYRMGIYDRMLESSRLTKVDRAYMSLLPVVTRGSEKSNERQIRAIMSTLRKNWIQKIVCGSWALIWVGWNRIADKPSGETFVGPINGVPPSVRQVGRLGLAGHVQAQILKFRNRKPGDRSPIPRCIYPPRVHFFIFFIMWFFPQQRTIAYG